MENVIKQAYQLMNKDEKKYFKDLVLLKCHIQYPSFYNFVKPNSTPVGKLIEDTVKRILKSEFSEIYNQIKND